MQNIADQAKTLMTDENYGNLHLYQADITGILHNKTII